MNFLTKSSLVLAVLAGASLSGAVQAQNLAITETTTPNYLTAGDYLYSYSVTPTFNTTSMTFNFDDTSVNFVSDSGPLSLLGGADGVFAFSGPKTNPLAGGKSETFNFTSFNAPTDFVQVDSSGKGFAAFGASTSTGPAAVPEASTTVSLGLLLMLGLGGMVLAARKKSAQTPA